MQACYSALTTPPDPALTGAASTKVQSPASCCRGSATSPTLDLQVASSHLTSNGDLNTGAAGVPSQPVFDQPLRVLPEDGHRRFLRRRAPAVPERTLRQRSQGGRLESTVATDCWSTLPVLLSRPRPLPGGPQKCSCERRLPSTSRRPKRRRSLLERSVPARRRSANVFLPLGGIEELGCRNVDCDVQVEEGQEAQRFTLCEEEACEGHRYLVVVRKGSSLVTTSMGIVRWCG